MGVIGSAGKCLESDNCFIQSAVRLFYTLVKLPAIAMCMLPDAGSHGVPVRGIVCRNLMRHNSLWGSDYVMNNLCYT